ncbi:MAG: phosphoribosylformylglycinamidine synthase subunit PurS [Alphaproteobacteria bacterium]|jgi:phosphoribosylformylglycinamidine synthase PurS subunit|nr:MAG: phosphoribosylformylglycinamidine synthase subunit PurS [Alphaproteobacteria bacterium]|tara:strand:- start:131 stop:382 length:252 start_codon:yes stop_codon:yes gene_type:complete
MKFKINIFLKKGVLDPEGKAIENALLNNGYNKVNNVRVGKTISLNIKSDIKSDALEQVTLMCKEMLVNNVIEDFEIVPSEEDK